MITEFTPDEEAEFRMRYEFATAVAKGGFDMFDPKLRDSIIPLDILQQTVNGVYH